MSNTTFLNEILSSLTKNTASPLLITERPLLWIKNTLNAFKTTFRMCSYSQFNDRFQSTLSEEEYPLLHSLFYSLINDHSSLEELKKSLNHIHDNSPIYTQLLPLIYIHNELIRIPLLTIAVLNEDIEKTTLLLQNNFSPNLSDSNGFTPFHIAQIIGNDTIISLFKKYGADDTIKNIYGATPNDIESFREEPSFPTQGVCLLNEKHPPLKNQEDYHDIFQTKFYAKTWYSTDTLLRYWLHHPFDLSPPTGHIISENKAWFSYLSSVFDDAYQGYCKRLKSKTPYTPIFEVRRIKDKDKKNMEGQFEAVARNTIEKGAFIEIGGRYCEYREAAPSTKNFLSLDVSFGGTGAEFINDSMPNAKVITISHKGVPRKGIFFFKSVKKGELILFHYGPYHPVKSWESPHIEFNPNQIKAFYDQTKKFTQFLSIDEDGFNYSSYTDKKPTHTDKKTFTKNKFLDEVSALFENQEQYDYLICTPSSLVAFLLNNPESSVENLIPISKRLSQNDPKKNGQHFQNCQEFIRFFHHLNLSKKEKKQYHSVLEKKGFHHLVNKLGFYDNVIEK